MLQDGSCLADVHLACNKHSLRYASLALVDICINRATLAEYTLMH